MGFEEFVTPLRMASRRRRDSPEEEEEEEKKVCPFPDEVLEKVLVSLKSHKDRSYVSLVCKDWYNAERWSRTHIFIGNCYSVTPEILIRRFPNIRSVTLKGKPRFSDFNLVPPNWGADIQPWLVVFASAYPFLEELRLKRMSVSDESLEFVAQSFPNFKALSLVSCEGFSTDGLAAIATHCKRRRRGGGEEEAHARFEGPSRGKHPPYGTCLGGSGPRAGHKDGPCRITHF